jgi:hypothetical protein
MSVTTPSSSRRESLSDCSGDLLQEDVEGVLVLLGDRVELAGALDERAEVLQAPLGLDRALGLERVDVAGLVEHRLEQVADRDPVGQALAQLVHRGHEARERLDRRGAQARHGARVLGGLPDRDAHRVGVREDPLQRRLADAALGRVGDPRELDDVLRVVQPEQVRHRVLDLRAVVELRAADDLVADLAPHERVLEDPRERVGPVEDRDLREAAALVDVTVDLADDVPRLGVLVVELADLDRRAAPLSLHSDFSMRSRLLAMTALAASSTVCVER